MSVETFCNETVESRDLVIGVVESIHNFKWQSSKIVNKSRFRKSFFVPDELVSMLVSRCITCNPHIHASIRGVMVGY